ncbi:MAG: hypothetical protein OXH68_15250 [Gammaproteobacteria bacterium]|nr:hypothetical protein [Gammaproteobacteria bacterium]
MLRDFFRKHTDSAIVLLIGVVVGYQMGVHAFAPHTPELPPAATPSGLTVIVDELRATGWFPPLVDRVAAEEGFSAETYQDAGGTSAIGYGTNITTGGITTDQQAYCGVSANPSVVTEPQGHCLLETGLAYRWRDFRADESFVSDLPDAVKAGLLDMVYEVGVGGTENFGDMIDSLRAGDYMGAADAVRQSLWFQEDPARAGEFRGILLAHAGPE